MQLKTHVLHFGWSVGWLKSQRSGNGWRIVELCVLRHRAFSMEGRCDCQKICMWQIYWMKRGDHRETVSPAQYKSQFLWCFTWAFNARKRTLKNFDMMETFCSAVFPHHSILHSCRSLVSSIPHYLPKISKNLPILPNSKYFSNITRTNSSSCPEPNL